MRLKKAVNTSAKGAFYRQTPATLKPLGEKREIAPTA